MSVEAPVYAEVASTGSMRSFGTGAVRDSDEGKPRVWRIFKYWTLGILKRVIQHYVNGAKRYGDHNWLKGIPASECLASLCDHYYKYLKGDRSEDHLSAIIFNAACVIEWEETGRKDMLDV